MTIRVGVIGVGVMGAEHARRLHRVIGGASVCGVTDFAADRAEALAAELGARVLVSVGFMRRFDPGYVELAASVRSGTVGEPLLVRCSHRNVAGYPGGDSAETITNTAIHEIDITQWMFESEIIEVSWHAGKSIPTDPHRQDPQLLLLRNENDTLTVLDVFVNARYGYDVRCVR